MKQVELLQTLIADSEALFVSVMKNQNEMAKKAKAILTLMNENKDILDNKTISKFESIERCLNDLCCDAKKIDRPYLEFKKEVMDVITSKIAYHEAYYG